MDVVKRIAEIIPFLEPYPPWVKIVVGCWTLFSAVVLLCLLFATRKSQTVEPLHLSGRVVSTGTVGVQAATVELAIAGVRLETVTDSEGQFGIDTSQPATTVSGRVRIAAAGYRSYDRVIQVSAARPDLGVFTLQSDASSLNDPAAELQRRQELVFEVPRDITDKYASLVSKGNAGVVTLLSDQVIEANRAIIKIQGDGKYYSFLRRSHEYGYGSDIKFESGSFATGFAGLDYGYFLNLGDIPFEQIVAATAGASWIPPGKRAAWVQLWNYTPPTVTIEVRRAQRDARNQVMGGLSVADRVAATPGNSYLLRSISFNRSDLLVAVRAERLRSDGSVVIVWKILKTNDTPVASGPEPG